MGSPSLLAGIASWELHTVLASRSDVRKNTSGSSLASLKSRYSNDVFVARSSLLGTMYEDEQNAVMDDPWAVARDRIHDILDGAVGSKSSDVVTNENHDRNLLCYYNLYTNAVAANSNFSPYRCQGR
jgi:hypothetical protein